MAILLKKQLLREIKYHPPVFGSDYYNKNFHSIANKKQAFAQGKRLFYDFYAMELLWSILGSGSRPKKERERWKKQSEEDPMKYWIGNFLDRPITILSDSQRKLIDDLFEQVTVAVAKHMQHYLHLLVIQEFRRIFSYSTYSSFIYESLNAYNKNFSMSRHDLDKIIEDHIPNMMNYEGTLYRLVKFNLIYTGGNKTNDLDESNIQDIILNVLDGKDVSNPKEISEIYGREEEKPPISSKIKPVRIKNVARTMSKTGLNLRDLEICYNNIPWEPEFGGKSYGAITNILLQLMEKRKHELPEDLIHIIDQIYDLQHNTGSVLNKGPLYVSKKSLDRRANITNLSSYLPDVSPEIKKVIIHYLHYIDKNSELEIKKQEVLHSKKINFSTEEKSILKKLGFKENKSYSHYNVGVKFPNENQKKYYVSAHGNNYYILTNKNMTMVELFKSFDELIEYINKFKKYIIGLPAEDLDNYISLNDDEKNNNKITLDRFTDELAKKHFALTVDMNHLNKEFSIKLYHKGTAVGNVTIKKYSENYRLKRWFSYFISLNSDYYGKKIVKIVPYYGFRAIIGIIKNFLSDYNLSYYRKKSSELPLNSESSRNYNMVSSAELPKHTIRLTTEDENMLSNLGFKPILLDHNVVYIDGKHNNSAIFYPNNTAKYTSNTGRLIHKNIKDLLFYIQDIYEIKYKLKAEFKTEEFPSEIVSPSGTKLSSMIEKLLSKVGFGEWSDKTKDYYDPKAMATLVVDPYPHSKIVFNYMISPKYFHTLPELMNYIKNDYLTDKQKVIESMEESRRSEKKKKLNLKVANFNLNEVDKVKENLQSNQLIKLKINRSIENKYEYHSINIIIPGNNQKILYTMYKFLDSVYLIMEYRLYSVNEGGGLMDILEESNDFSGFLGSVDKRIKSYFDSSKKELYTENDKNYSQEEIDKITSTIHSQNPSLIIVEETSSDHAIIIKEPSSNLIMWKIYKYKTGPTYWIDQLKSNGIEFENISNSTSLDHILIDLKKIVAPFSGENYKSHTTITKSISLNRYDTYNMKQSNYIPYITIMKSYI